MTEKIVTQKPATDPVIEAVMSLHQPVEAGVSQMYHPYPPMLFLFDDAENVQRQLGIETPSGKRYNLRRIRGILCENLFQLPNGVERILDHYMDVRRGKAKSRLTEDQVSSLTQASALYRGMKAVETRNKMMAREKTNRRLLAGIVQLWGFWQQQNLVPRKGRHWLMLDESLEVIRPDTWTPANVRLDACRVLFGSEENAALRLGGEITSERWIEWQRQYATRLLRVVAK